MHKVTLEINSKIYEHIMFFLRNLPQNFITIRQDIEVDAKLLNSTFSASKLKKLQGVGKELYRDVE